MPINIKNKQNCTGCSACYNICPQNCISMISDIYGFWYPEINSEHCSKCEQCVRVCPVLHKNHTIDTTPDVYAAWSKDEKTRYTSTSGGAFSELASSILDIGGLVIGAAYNEDNYVEHIGITSRKDIAEIRQSKYIQSDIGTVYQLAENYLEKNIPVMFCGTPCQVAGLKSYIKKQYDCLYTIDFICRGVNSPRAYRYWLDELESSHMNEVKRVWFKYKADGWKKSPFCTRIDFKSGEPLVLSGDRNYFMKGYLHGNLYLRPSCSNCHFKGSDRFSDITLADFWKISDELDDDKGTSLLMINSQNGEKLLEMAQESLYVYKRSFTEIKEGNICFNQSVEINPKSSEFLRRLEEKPFSELVKEYTKISWIKKIRKKLLRIPYKIRINNAGK